MYCHYLGRRAALARGIKSENMHNYATLTEHRLIAMPREARDAVGLPQCEGLTKERSEAASEAISVNLGPHTLIPGFAVPEEL